MNDIIVLSDKEPVASGKKRIVFEHPENTDYLIKVYRNHIKQAKQSLYQRHYNRYTYLSGFLREIREYILLKSDNQSPLTGHIPKIIGLIDTDLGLGLTVQKLVNNKGDLAVNLRELTRSQCLSQELQKKLDDFFYALVQSNIVIGDLNIRNIVLAYHDKEGYKFYLVDGLGDKTFIPMKRYCKTIRKSYKSKRIKIIGRRVKG